MPEQPTIGKVTWGPKLKPSTAKEWNAFYAKKAHDLGKENAALREALRDLLTAIDAEDRDLIRVAAMSARAKALLEGKR